MTDTHRQARLSHRVETAYRLGTSHRWVACLAASRIVGRYQVGATQSLAKRLALDVSQVENLARAGATYRSLRPFGVLSAIRLKLTYTHFAVLGELMRRYEFSPQDALAYLKLAAENGSSIKSMAYYITGVEGSNLPDEWRERLGKIKKDCARLVNDYGIDPRVRNTTKAYLKRLATLEEEIE